MQNKQENYLSKNLMLKTQNTHKVKPLMLNVQKLLPNLPPLFNTTHFKWGENESSPKVKEDCTNRPHLIDIQFNNKYWQVFEGKRSKYFLYAAYLDIRNRNKFPSVRINGFIEKDKEHTQIYIFDSL